MLKNWDERTTRDLSLRSIIQTAYRDMSKYPQAVAVPFVPPTIPGLGASGGFNFELMDLGGHTVDQLATVNNAFMAAAAKRPELTSLRSAMRATVPQIQVDLDRTKIKTLGINVSDVFKNMQAYLGGLVVNQFVLFDRVWNVMIQAEPELPRDAGQHQHDLRPQRSGRNGPALDDHPRQQRRRARPDPALQHEPRGRDHGKQRGRLQHGSGADRAAGRRQANAAGRLHVRLGGHRLSASCGR